MLKVCSIQEFLDNIKQVNHIICFGAGRRLELLSMILENTKERDKIIYVIDNDKKKQNTKVSIVSKEYDIISLEDFKKKKLSNFIIIITCAQYDEIIKQLNSDEVFRPIDIYSLSLIMEKDALQKEIPLEIKRSEKPIIPKIIHYCWFGGNPIPERYKIWMDSWHKFCPDYEIIQWNETNYDITQNSYMFQAYKNEKWGFVPDYARLDIIYNYGGIYLDTDVELIKNIDDLLYQKGFIGFQNSKRVNLGSGFGSIKGLPIMKKMMDLYDRMEFVKEDGNFNLVASPKWQTQILKEYGLEANGEYQIIDDLTVYPEKVLNGKNMYTRKTILKPYTMAIHHFDGSWLDKKTKELIRKIEDI